MTRVLRASGGFGAALLALLWSRQHVPPMVDAAVNAHPPKPWADLAWSPLPSPTELFYGQVNPRIFGTTIEIVLAAGLAWFGLEALLARREAGRRALSVVGPLLAAVGVLVAFFGTGSSVPPALVMSGSKVAGGLALGVLVPACLIYARYEPGGEPAPDRKTRGLEVTLLVLEAIALGWGVWLTCWPAVGILSLVVLLGLVAAAAYRAGVDLARASTSRALERDALVGSPLLLLAFLGMRREPSPAWVALALAVSVVIALVLLRRPLPSPKIATALAAVAGPTALSAIFLMPMRFRELASIDNFDHESQHLGWVNAVTFGKLMMADAGFIYGPLREYLLSLYCAIGGFTLERVREAHVWTSFLGVALMMWVGWRVSRGRPWLHLWWLYILVAHSSLVFLVHYKDQLSFGWVDMGRAGLACAALVGGIEWATADRRGSVPWRRFVREHRGLLLWGALAGTATLYSQDYGPCAIGSVGLAILADAALRRGLGSPRERVMRAVRQGLAWSAGAALVLALFVLVYACFGRAGLMLHRFATWTGLILSAGWSGGPFPVSAGDWLKPTLFGARDKFVLLDFATPAVFIAVGGIVLTIAAVRRTWTARVTLLFAIFAFAFTTVRHAMIRPDMFHVRSDGMGAVLFFFALLCDLSQLRWYAGSRARAVPIGAVTVAAVAVGWAVVVQSWVPVKNKLAALVTGDESPQPGAPYDNHDAPRGGDANVPANVKALVRYVDGATKPTDPVWVTMGWSSGGAYQFIIDRRNPTPFDVAQELITFGDQAELRGVLHDDPPILIVGDYFNLIGDEARAYIEAHWRRENAVPGFSIRRYDPTSFQGSFQGGPAGR